MASRPTSLLLLTLWLASASVAPTVVAPPAAHAQEVDPTAQQVLDAIAADDAERLKELALLDDPDPWYVADQLYLRGELDAALAFARAAPRPDTETLPEYLESRRGKEPDAKAREVLSSATDAARTQDWPRALRILDGAAKTDEPYAAIRLRFLRAGVLAGLGRTADSVALFEMAAEDALKEGWLLRANSALTQAGMTAYRAQQYALGVPPWRRQIELAERRGDRRQKLASITNTAILLRSLDRYEEALALQERALVMAVEDGDGVIESANLVNIASTLKDLEQFHRALDFARRGHAKAVEVGHREFERNALSSIGTLLTRLRRHDEAIQALEQSLALSVELADEGGRAMALAELGTLHSDLGSSEKAEQLYREALAIRRAQGNRYGEALLLANLGVVFNLRGEDAKALAHFERALEIEEELGHREGIARCLINLGATLHETGRPSAAITRFERAYEIYQELGKTQLALQSLGNMAGTYNLLGQPEKTIECAKRVLDRLRPGEAPQAKSQALANIGAAYVTLEDFERAREYLTRSFEVMEVHGDLEDRCLAAKELAVAELRAENMERARHYRDMALARAEESGDVQLQTLAYGLSVIVDAIDGKYEEATKRANELVGLLAFRMNGFEQLHGADARDRYSNVMSYGAHAAARAGDATSTLHLIESGRAFGLLEALGGRERVSAAVVSEPLRLAEADARARLEDAQAALGDALRGRNLDVVKTARAAIEQAQKKHIEVVERIQRAKKAGAALAYPKAADLSAIQEGLRPGDALVLYDSRPEQTLAMVVMSTSAKIVGMEPVPPPTLPTELGGDWDGEIERLRAALVEPLGLGDDVKCLLVSPSAALALVPFQLLAPELDVAYAPSGTAHLRLRESAETRGEKVLALGDPAYEKLRGSRAAEVHHGNRVASLLHARLAPLPGTRKEAIAVGDVTLLGEEASETRLAAELAKQERWRAVHLACHGLVVPDRPSLSSLAITPDAESDGALTVLEILRADIPSDLVVLSACETGRGKVSASEGVVGFTRAFMVAGSPRVIVSLWKVDDTATSALMQKFYELWKPGGVDTATALRKAQEHVAAQEKWKDPYYWAAWQLWGLPD